MATTDEPVPLHCVSHRSKFSGDSFDLIIYIPRDRTINDFDLATFHQWLKNQGYNGT